MLRITFSPSLAGLSISDLPCSVNANPLNHTLSRLNTTHSLSIPFPVLLFPRPPLKSAYPYHYHLKNEETFFILRREGIPKTPEGERPVKTGNFIFFPADSSGAHKLTNCSETVPLVYIDFDTQNDLDVALYPDSGKIGVWGKNANRVYKTDDNIDYYDGE